MAVDFKRIVYLGEFRYTLIRKDDCVTATECLMNGFGGDVEKAVDYSGLPKTLQQDFNILVRGDVPSIAA